MTSPEWLRRFAAVYRRRPVVSTVIVCTVAAGLGATLTATSVATALLLRPLSFARPGEVVQVSGLSLSRPGRSGGMSPADFLDFKSRATSFAAFAAFNSYEGSFQGRGDAIRVTVGTVTDGFLDVLRLRPALGRLLTAEDYVGPLTAVVLTNRFWRETLGSDPSVVGSTVVVNGRARTVVGVLPDMQPEFPATFALWSPMRVNPGATRSATFLSVIARVRSGATIAAAQAEMNVIALQLAKEFPVTNAERRVAVTDLRDEIAGPVAPMLGLIAAVLFVIVLVVCANVGLLLMSLAHARRREFAVRLAIGASTRRLARQLLGENLVLTAVGGALGLALVPPLTTLLVRYYPGALPRASEMGISIPVIATALGMILATAAAASIPALRRAATVDLTRDLGNGARASMRTGSAPALLVVSQVALTLVLMFAGTVLVRAFLAISNTNPGFRADGLLTFNIATPPARYPTIDRYLAFYDALYARIERLPGVEAVGGSNLLPFAPGNLDEYIVREGYGDTPNRLLGSTQWVTPGYIDALRLPMLRGRPLAATDRDSLAPVIVVNNAFATSAFPDEDAIGKRLTFRGHTWTIVGVFGDKRHIGLGENPKPEILIPRAASSVELYSTWVAIRTRGAPASLVADVRNAVRDLDPTLPVADVASMSERVSRSLAPERFRALLVGALGALALALAVIGVYGIIADTVARQLREIGIRIALGASARDVMQIAAGRVLALVAVGIAIGLALSWAAGRGLASLFGSGVTGQPGALVLAAAALLVATGVAALVPSRRAMRIDPRVIMQE